MTHTRRNRYTPPQAIRGRYSAPVPEKDLIPLAQAVREFEISPSTIYRHIAAGRLTAHTRAGGKVRTFVDRGELRKLLEPKPMKKRR